MPIDISRQEQVARPRGFPDRFIWGTATSAYQIEGATTIDGRGSSVWDVYSRKRGKIRGGSNGDIAADHFHRYRDDVGLMRTLGVNAYRFSIAWPRVFPRGRGRPNPNGLDFYDRLVDALLEAGIEPFATLYHWDLPQALQDRGGWETRETAHAFADYAAYVSSRMTDRVRHLVTINEMKCVADGGYGTGDFAPGMKLPSRRLHQTRYHVLLAHGLALAAIRAAARATTAVGIAENITLCIPIVETPEHVCAAEKATREVNAAYLTAIMEGRYVDGYLEAAGRSAPHCADRDFAAIGAPVDFVGLNVYMPDWFVRASDAPAGYTLIAPPKKYPHMADARMLMCPEGLYWAPRHVSRIWSIRNLYITENGCPATDVRRDGGGIEDADRITYLRSYLYQLQRAVEEGVPVRGYFHWSLLDNFEWSLGYTRRYGLYHVDRETLERRPKRSATFYSEMIRRNAIL